MKQTAFITGATSGIGKATAEIFAKNNIRLILCGRRSARLEKLQQTLSQFTEVTTL
jgi:short-subunit dehydrogenase